MRLEDLHASLRTSYTAERGFGADRVEDPRYRHVVFIVPPPPPVELPADLPIDALRRARGALSRMPDFADADDEYALVNHFFVRREALQSSRMEGTYSTIDEVLTPGDGTNEESTSAGLRSVRGYAKTLEKHFSLAQAKREAIFTEATVKEIHRDIVSRDPSFRGTPGEYRDTVAWIGGGSRRPEDSVYNPAPPVRIESSMARVLAWLSDQELAARGDAGAGGFGLPLRIAIGHAHFEAVHPFSDGNGRVGRALWPLQMIAAEHFPLYLSGFVEAEKHQYGEALGMAQRRRDYAPIVEFICEAIIASEREATETIAAMRKLPGQWGERAKFRGGSTALRALELLARYPIISTEIIGKELAVSRQAANVAVTQLIERGILRRRDKIGKLQYYGAEELIALLGRDFGSDVDRALERGRQLLQG